MHLRVMLQKGRTGIILSLCTCFLITIYAPLEMFFYNIDDFWFNFSTIFPICLVLFLALWLVGGLLFCFLGAIQKKIYGVAVFVAFVLLICTYIQGTFLINNLPPMDGTNIDWSQYSVENIKTLILWIIVFLFCIALWRLLKTVKFLRLIEGISLFLFGMLLVSIITAGVITGGYKNKDLLAITNKNEFEYSQDTNFIIFILDAVDAGTVTDLMRLDSTISEAFCDFTYYENTMCVYPFTQYSIPFILSGDWYLNDQKPMDYFQDAIADSPFINSIKKDYKMQIYSDSVSVVSKGNEQLFDNMGSDYGTISSYSLFIKGIIKTAGIRYAPFPAKQMCYNALERLNEARELKETIEEEQIFSCDNRDFYRELQEKKLTFTNDKLFKMIHLEGAHVPYRYNKNVERIENGTYEENVAASMTIASAWLNKLRENKVYDHSVIIIMADHGYNVKGLYGRQNPILFVKGIDEHHEMKISDAPISYVDLQGAYQELLDGKAGDSIFSWEENEERQRRYILYDYEEEEIMYEYTSKGHASETEKLELTGNEYRR